MEFPSVTKNVLYHVGDLAKGREKVYSSYECGALSVSEVPFEWMDIAELSGEIWQLRKRMAVFVDMLAIEGTTKCSLRQEAVGEGLLFPVELYRLSYFDDEQDCIIYVDYDSRSEAEDEMEMLEDGEVEVVQGYKASGKLDVLWKERFTSSLSNALAEDFAFTYLIEQRGLYDGVWWDERLDPLAYSAPRGGIFQSRLSSWEKRIVSEEEFHKEAERTGKSFYW